MKLLGSIFAVILLLGQVNLPLYFHICARTHDVLPLASCELCEPVEVKESCCEKSLETAEHCTSATFEESCCEITFVQEHSHEATVGKEEAPRFVLDGTVQVFGNGHHHYSFNTGSPAAVTFRAESPPIYILDSAFLI